MKSDANERNEKNEKNEIEARLQAAIKAATSVQSFILKSYQDPDLVKEKKKDASVVTEVDREVERKLRALLLAEFPDDSVIGEEQSAVQGSGDFTWILDPIDGTESFVCGVPLFGTMIGLTFKSEPAAGVVMMPALDELYYAAKGCGSWWRSPSTGTARKAQVSATASLKESLFCTTSQAGFQRAGRKDLFLSLLERTRKFRGWGSCYGHLLVATGRADLMMEPHVQVWDCAALYSIVTEAGGRFFDLEGKFRIDGGSGISCNSNLFSEVMELVQSKKD